MTKGTLPQRASQMTFCSARIENPHVHFHFLPDASPCFSPGADVPFPHAAPAALDAAALQHRGCGQPGSILSGEMAGRFPGADGAKHRGLKANFL